MRRALVVAVATMALGAGAAAPPALSQHGAGPEPAPPIPASIGFDAVTPQHLDVLLGDTVHWTNVSVRVHTVTADDGSFDSGRLSPEDSYTRTFTALGDAPYHCVIHPFIRGDVEVHSLLLKAPAQPAASNRPFPLAGRAALAAGSAVTIEADRGSGFAPVASATVAADGSFAADIVPGQTASYRAVAGTDTSPPVQLLVLDRTIAIRARRDGRRGLAVQAAVTPASPGATVVLQLFLHEHFGWWPVQRTKLGRASTARFALRLRRRVAARVLLTLPDGATPLAVSRTIRVGRRR
jgi:plastocyanin